MRFKLLLHVSVAATIMWHPSMAGLSDCKFNVNGYEYDLSPLRGTTIEGHDANFTSSRVYKLSVCDDLVHPCIDSLTKTPINGSMFQFGATAGSPTFCWDVIAHWGDVQALPVDASPHSLTEQPEFSLFFSHDWDAHLDCKHINMTVDMFCSPHESKGAMTGYQDGCSWKLGFHTMHACRDSSTEH